MTAATQSRASILVVEDEAPIATAVAARLRSEGFDVEIAADGTAGIEKAEQLRPDLVVLDLMLPGVDGLEVCRRIQKDSPVPVLMLTARDTETDTVVGLEVGADDYMTKPFSLRELVARVHALLRRTSREPKRDQPIRVSNIVIEPDARRVTKAGETIHLTPTEFDLLLYLARHKRSVFPRERLLGEVWGYRDGAGARTVDSHVRGVRRKLGDDIIRTVHGVGYAFGEVSP
jgi:DNA-binding response OmpR family regulator